MIGKKRFFYFSLFKGDVDPLHCTNRLCFNDLCQRVPYIQTFYNNSLAERNI